MKKKELITIDNERSKFFYDVIHAWNIFKRTRKQSSRDQKNLTKFSLID